MFSMQGHIVYPQGLVAEEKYRYQILLVDSDSQNHYLDRSLFDPSQVEQPIQVGYHDKQALFLRLDRLLWRWLLRLAPVELYPFRCLLVHSKEYSRSFAFMVCELLLTAF